MLTAPVSAIEEGVLVGPTGAIKAAFDRAIAFAALVVTAPLLLALATAVRLTSPGPAFFGQDRVGRDGHTFRLWKFRSMDCDAEERLHELLHLNEHDGVMFKIRDDPRITPFGRLLRSFSLDELPQLFNVLRGDMSLVGPRPPLPQEVAAYDARAHQRFLVKPGMTGLSQVSGRSDLDWEESLDLDLRYIESWSFRLDLTLLVRTLSTVLRRRGAY
jgi:exopolysaccharide biosynthesis polyprenyl glycosylphosphotransferase